MNDMMTGEMFWLTATVVMTALFWIPYILNRMQEQGVPAALWDPHGETATRRAWASRMMAAHRNAVENLAIFAPLVLLLQQAGISTGLTLLACKLYFFARLIHYLVFTFAVPLLRVVAFLAGFAAQMMLAASLPG